MSDTKPAKNPSALKKNGTRFLKFFRDVKGESKKIVWPSLKEVINNTVVVVALCLSAGVFVWLLDTGLSYFVSLLLNAK